MSSRTVVEYFANDSGYKCGYCGNEDTSLSNGMWAHRLTVQDYQDLINRGWRRSGKYVYKPVMDETCCPQYTIRCTAGEFKITKSHKKTIKRFNRYINTGVHGGADHTLPRSSDLSDDGVNMSDVPAERMHAAEHEQLELGHIDASRLQAPSSGDKEKLEADRGGMSGELQMADTDHTNSTEPSKLDGSKKQPKPGLGANPNLPACQKAKERRKERWRQKHGPTDGEEPRAKTSKPNEAKGLEEILGEIVTDSKHKFEVRLVRSSPQSDEFNASFEESYKVYQKYQMAIHGDPPEKPSQRQYTNFLVQSPLQVRLVRSCPHSEVFNETLDESYGVYRRYQMTVHHDGPGDCDRSTYLSFLVNSPLEPYYREGGMAEGYGSFHQQYLVDGKIVAVGVIDILPSCVSSVYLYYDPEYFFLSMGTYSALQELAFVRRLTTQEPSIVSYYMGFYIHSCPKMRYKAQYVPSFLLCPESYIWVPIESCRPKLDESKYARLAESANAKDEQRDIDLGKVLVLFERQALPFQFYSVVNPEAEDQAEVLQYARLVGKQCAERILLVRS